MTKWSHRAASNNKFYYRRLSDYSELHSTIRPNSSNALRLCFGPLVVMRCALCIRPPHIPSDDKRQWRTQHTLKLARTFRPTRPTTMTKSINIRGIRKYKIQIEYRLVIVIIGCVYAPVVAVFAVVVRWNSLWSGVGQRAQKDSGSCHANNMQIVVWCMACNPIAYCNIDT